MLRREQLTRPRLGELNTTEDRFSRRCSRLEQLCDVSVDQDVKVLAVKDGVQVAESSRLTLAISDLVGHQ